MSRVRICAALTVAAVALGWSVALMEGLAPAAAAGRARATATPNCAASRWVGSWESPPGDGLGGISGSLSEEAVPGAGENDKAMLTGGTFRLILTPHLGGSELRVHLSNRFGGAPVTFTHASIAITSSGAGLEAGSVRPLTFAGQPTVTIPAGADATSDPVALSFAAFQTLAVSLYTAHPLPDGITEHFTARQISYFAPVAAGDESLSRLPAPFTVETTTRPFVDGLDVLAEGNVSAVVTLGDSITDGYGGEPADTAANPLGETENPVGIGLNERWPDDLARRLLAAGRPLSVLNAGISGNRILAGGASGMAAIVAVYGPSALGRLTPDVLGQSGVSDVIVLEGINDLADSSTPDPAAVIAGLTQLVDEIRSAGLSVQLGTLTPVGGSTDGTAAIEAARDQVNAWIRSQIISDGIIDFDRALRDPADPERLLPADDSGDGLHPSPAGYQAMADAVDLSRLRAPDCASATATSSTSTSGTTARAGTATPTAPRLRVSGVQRQVRVGRAVTERFLVRVLAGGRLHPVPGAVISLNRRRARTDAGGRAVLRCRFRRRGRYRARVSAAGDRPTTVTIAATG